MIDVEAWRLLIDPPCDPAWNMAVDEAMLDAYVAGRSDTAPTIRLYAWRCPALSLGRNQDAASSHASDYLYEQGIDLVRRPTGGAAVLHEHERTYSIVGRLDRAPFAGGVVETYRKIAEVVADALRKLGAQVRVGAMTAPRRVGPSCFAVVSANEITHAGHKLVGAAQLRRRRCFLQHGSIPLRCDPERLSRALGLPEAAAHADLEQATGRRVEARDLDHALVAAFEARFGAQACRSHLSDGELARATRLYTWKYCSACWTLEGKIGEREKRWGGEDSPQRAGT